MANDEEWHLSPQTCTDGARSGRPHLGERGPLQEPRAAARSSSAAGPTQGTPPLPHLLQVLWENANGWFQGTLTAHEPGRHFPWHLLYEDGDTAWLRFGVGRKNELGALAAGEADGPTATYVLHQYKHLQPAGASAPADGPGAAEAQPPVKRKRGRPPGSGKKAAAAKAAAAAAGAAAPAAAPAEQPAAGGPEAADEEAMASPPKRRRGRPPKNQPAAAAVPSQPAPATAQPSQQGAAEAAAGPAPAAAAEPAGSGGGGVSVAVVPGGREVQQRAAEALTGATVRLQQPAQAPPAVRQPPAQQKKSAPAVQKPSPSSSRQPDSAQPAAAVAVPAGAANGTLAAASPQDTAPAALRAARDPRKAGAGAPTPARQAAAAVAAQQQQHPEARPQQVEEAQPSAPLVTPQQEAGQQLPAEQQAQQQQPARTPARTPGHTTSVIAYQMADQLATVSVVADRGGGGKPAEAGGPAEEVCRSFGQMLAGLTSKRDTIKQATMLALQAGGLVCTRSARHKCLCMEAISSTQLHCQGVVVQHRAVGVAGRQPEQPRRLSTYAHPPLPPLCRPSAQPPATPGPGWCAWCWSA